MQTLSNAGHYEVMILRVTLDLQLLKEDMIRLLWNQIKLILGLVQTKLSSTSIQLVEGLAETELNALPRYVYVQLGA